MNQDDDAKRERESQRVRDFILKPGFQMDYRHALYTISGLKGFLPKVSNDQRTAIETEFAQEESFLFFFSFIYPFYRYVRKSEMERRNKWYWNQVKEIGYLILLDLFHPEKAVPSEAERKPKQSPTTYANEPDDWVPIQNFTRIRSHYPELFFAPPKLHAATLKSRKRRTDKRFSRYSTIFSEMPYDGDELDNDTRSLLSARTAAATASMNLQEIEQRKEVTAGLRMVDPDDVLGLERFWELELRSLEIITANYGQPSQNDWLLPHLRKGSAVIESMYQLVDKAVALRWYRTIKSKRRKEQLFREKHPLRYSSEDARRAVEANVRWFKDPIQVADLIFRGASAYSQMGMFAVALVLYKECIKQVPLDSKDLGLSYHNMGIAYRNMKVPRKYLIYLKKALEVFEELGPFDVGITWAYIAEAYQMLGNKRKFEEAKNLSKKILSSETLSNHQLSEAFLLMADCAAVSRDTGWEKEALASGLDAAVKADNLELASYYIQRSTDLEHGRDTLIAEQEPGKLKRPPLFQWHREPTHFTAISPKSNKTNDGD